VQNDGILRRDSTWNVYEWGNRYAVREACVVNQEAREFNARAICASPRNTSVLRSTRGGDWETMDLDGLLTSSRNAKFLGRRDRRCDRSLFENCHWISTVTNASKRRMNVAGFDITGKLSLFPKRETPRIPLPAKDIRRFDWHFARRALPNPGTEIDETVLRPAILFSYSFLIFPPRKFRVSHGAIVSRIAREIGWETSINRVAFIRVKWLELGKQGPFDY